MSNNTFLINFLHQTTLSLSRLLHTQTSHTSTCPWSISLPDWCKAATEQLEPINSRHQMHAPPADRQLPMGCKWLKSTVCAVLHYHKAYSVGTFQSDCIVRDSQLKKLANHITVGNCQCHYNDVPRPWTIGRAYSTKSSISTGQAPANDI